MGIHKPFDRRFFVIDGNVMTSGGSLNLAKGQFGLFNTSSQSANGLAAVSSLTGIPKSTKLQMKLGVHPLALDRSSTNKAWSTPNFTVNDIIDVKVSAPDSTELVVDEVILGYNGIDTNTAITFKKGDRKKIFIKLSGEMLGLLGYEQNYVTIEYVLEADACSQLENCVDCDSCDTVDCSAIVLAAVEFLNSFKLRGDVPLTDVVEINPVKSCATSPTYTESPYTFYSLTVTDMGDDIALAKVQAQYPDYSVVKTDRIGTDSVYQILAPDGTTLADYSQSIASLLKDCNDCPAGYTEVVGGELYAVSISDAGSDVSTTVDNLPGYVAGTVLKNGQDANIGFYTLVLDDKLTQAEINTFVTANPTAEVKYVGTVASICENSTVTSVEWVTGDSCNVSTERYEITVADDECGTSRLAELQANFPSLTIARKGTTARTITLTGSSGTANINVNGTDYLATYATSLTVTGANFVTAHAAALLAAGVTVTANAGVLTFTAKTIDYPTTLTITNATTNLAGTVGAAVETPVTGGCQSVYEADVITSMVCDECSDIFKQVYVSEAPANFNETAWTKQANATSYTDCKCGIKFKGKTLTSYPSEVFRDSFGFMESSVNIEVSGGYITDMMEGTGTIIDEPMKVTYLSKAAPRTHLGGNLFAFEEEANVFFGGKPRHTSLEAKALLGESSHLEANKQYVDYSITVRDTQYSNGMGGLHTTNNKYHVFVEFGKHGDVEDIINVLAGAAGLPGVKA